MTLVTLIRNAEERELSSESPRINVPRERADHSSNLDSLLTVILSVNSYFKCSACNIDTSCTGSICSGGTVYCPGWKSHISGTFWFEKKKMLRAEGRGSVTTEGGAEPAGHLTEQDIDSFLLTLGSKEE